MEFKEKLKEFRKKTGLTQIEFSDKYNFPRTTLSELESGRKKPTFKMIKKLSESTNTKSSFWIADSLNHSKFDGLELAINKMIANGMITSSGNLTPEAKDIILKIVEAEIVLSFLNHE